jgi:hypothetical protein
VNGFMRCAPRTTTMSVGPSSGTVISVTALCALHGGPDWRVSAAYQHQLSRYAAVALPLYTSSILRTSVHVSCWHTRNLRSVCSEQHRTFEVYVLTFWIAHRSASIGLQTSSRYPWEGALLPPL